MCSPPYPQSSEPNFHLSLLLAEFTPTDLCHIVSNKHAAHGGNTMSDFNEFTTCTPIYLSFKA